MCARREIIREMTKRSSKRGIHARSCLWIPLTQLQPRNSSAGPMHRPHAQVPCTGPMHRPHALQLFLHPGHKPPCAQLRAFSFHAYGSKAPVGSGESNPRNLRLRAEAPEEAPACNSSPVQKFQPGQPILTWVLSTPSESPPRSLEPGVTGQEDSGS